MATKTEEELGREAFIVARYGRAKQAPVGLVENGRGPPIAAETLAKMGEDYEAGRLAFQQVFQKVTR